MLEVRILWYGETLVCAVQIKKHFLESFSGTAHQCKCGRAEKGVTDMFFRPRPLERRKTPLLENTCLFLLKFYNKSGSEKISIAIKNLELAWG